MHLVKIFRLSLSSLIEVRHMQVSRYRRSIAQDTEPRRQEKMVQLEMVVYRWMAPSVDCNVWLSRVQRRSRTRGQEREQPPRPHPRKFSQHPKNEFDPRKLSHRHKNILGSDSAPQSQLDHKVQYPIQHRYGKLRKKPF